MSLTKVTHRLISGGAISVLDFGAATTNTDVQNGAAFQAAIDSLKNIGGTLLIPSGTFNITSISMPDETYNGIRIVGMSAQLTKAKLYHYWHGNHTWRNSSKLHSKRIV
jgi:hypothetical protein